MVRALSFHAAYRCRHAGACCTSGWPIPIEADRLAAMRAAIATGALQSPRAASASSLFVSPDDAPTDTPALLGVKDHACVFFDADHGRWCAVQRALGHDALPLACRQFPRVSVRDPRGASVTLSHYCPTAASLLGSSERVAIVTDAAAFPASGEYSGLDATTALPPLLREDVLMDWESWWLTEALAVDVLANRADSVEDALTRLRVVVADLIRWRPGAGPLIDRVQQTFADASGSESRSWRPTEPWLIARQRLALESVPRELRDSVPVTSTDRNALDPILLKQYLAAHAFASWTAHLGQGLEAWLRAIEVPFALIQLGMTVRHADLILRHLADPAQFAAACSRGNPV